MANRPRQVWDQQPGEHPRFYQLFLRYRSLPIEERSVKRLAEVTGLKADSLSKLSSRFKWTFRADQWESHMLARKEAATETLMIRSHEKATREYLESIYGLASYVKAAVERRLAKLLSEPKMVPVVDSKTGQPKVGPDGQPLMVDNPEYLGPGSSVIGDLAKVVQDALKQTGTENVDQSVSERRKEKEAVLAKLKKMAEDMEARTQQQDQPNT